MVIFKTSPSKIQTFEFQNLNDLQILIVGLNLLNSRTNEFNETELAGILIFMRNETKAMNRVWDC